MHLQDKVLLGLKYIAIHAGLFHSTRFPWTFRSPSRVHGFQNSCHHQKHLFILFSTDSFWDILVISICKRSLVKTGLPNTGIFCNSHCCCKEFPEVLAGSYEARGQNAGNTFGNKMALSINTHRSATDIPTVTEDGIWLRGSCHTACWPHRPNFKDSLLEWRLQLQTVDPACARTHSHTHTPHWWFCPHFWIPTLR